MRRTNSYRDDLYSHEPALARKGPSPAADAVALARERLELGLARRLREGVREVVLQAFSIILRDGFVALGPRLGECCHCCGWPERQSAAVWRLAALVSLSSAGERSGALTPREFI